MLMAEWSELEALLRTRLRGDRLSHTYRVVDTARKLAVRFFADEQKAAEAALMHDFMRSAPPDELLALGRLHNVITDPAEETTPLLLHGPVAAAVLAEQGLLTDADVIGAIRWHTTGRGGMTLLEKVIWLADYIEPGRSFSGVERVREQAEHDLNSALLQALEQSLRYLLDQRWAIHPAMVQAYNGALLGR